MWCARISYPQTGARLVVRPERAQRAPGMRTVSQAPVNRYVKPTLNHAQNNRVAIEMRMR